MPKRDIFRLAYTVNMLAGSSDTAEVMLYGEIVQDGPEWWKWSKEDKSAADFDKAIKEVQKNGATKLLVRINSPGGVCSESVAMRTILAAAQFEEITGCAPARPPTSPRFPAPTSRSERAAST